MSLFSFNSTESITKEEHDAAIAAAVTEAVQKTMAQIRAQASEVRVGTGGRLKLRRIIARVNKCQLVIQSRNPKHSAEYLEGIRNSMIRHMRLARDDYNVEIPNDAAAVHEMYAKSKMEAI